VILEPATQLERRGRLAGRIVLVTGATRGIGAAVAVACAAEGATLILVGRTRGGLEEVDDAVQAAGGTATLVPLDLTRGDQVDILGAPLFERFKRLDGLAACAAELGPLTPVGHLKPDQYQRVMTVNALANQRLIRTLEPLLRAAPDARAVFLTDGLGRDAAYWSAYASSKAALEAMVRAWAREVAITPIRVNLVDPGPVATRLRAQAFPGERPGTLRQPADVASAIVELLLPDCRRHGELVRIQHGS
jgi:NAD(P)-dependent dehydrogenase (short-subunit alcohol dehydrogenase family)